VPGQHGVNEVRRVARFCGRSLPLAFLPNPSNPR
jgi:hypothetical protein